MSGQRSNGGLVPRPVAQLEAKDTGDSTQVGVGADTQPPEPWEEALAPVAVALKEQEAARPTFWWSSPKAEPPAEVADGHASVWSSAFDELRGRPPEEAVRRLHELGVRPWQSLWRCLLEELVASQQNLAASASVAPGPVVGDGEGLPPLQPQKRRTMVPADWEEACRVIRQVASGDGSFEELRAPQHGVPKEGAPGDAGVSTTAASPMEKMFHQLQGAARCRRRLLRLQEQLLWLTQLVAASLAVPDLQDHFLRALQCDISTAAKNGDKPSQRGGLTGADTIAWLSDSTLSGVARAQRWHHLASVGFEFQAIHFRVIGDSDEWQTVCAEIKHVQDGQAPRLLVVVEGHGLRLLAVPALPPGELEMAVRPEPLCDLVAGLLQREGVPLPHDPEALRRWCASLPNPRSLLMLEVPMSRLIAARSGSSVHSAVEKEKFLALVFGSPSSSSNALGTSGLGAAVSTPRTDAEELTAGRCAQPGVIFAVSREAMAQQVSVALRCSLADLLANGAPLWPSSESAQSDIFGCVCEVWYSAGNAAGTSSSLWRWQSDRFAVVFSSLQALEFSCKHFSHELLAARLERARHHLKSSLGFPRHPRAVRSALHSHDLPSRFACALAEPRLAPVPEGFRPITEGHLPGSFAMSSLHEAVGAELVACATKHVVRAIFGVGAPQAPQQRQGPLSPAASPQGPLSPAPALVNGTSKEALGALKEDGGRADDESKPAPLPTRADTLGAIETEAPIPPLPPKGSQAVSSSAWPPPRCGVALESEVQHLLTALEIHPELDRVAKDTPPAARVAANRLGLLYVAFWTRLAAGAWQLASLASVAEAERAGPTGSGAADDSAALDTPSGFLADCADMLPGLGRQLLRAAWGAPPTLARALSSQLRVELTASVLRRVRPIADSALASLPLWAPRVEPSRLPDIHVVQVAHFAAKAPLPLEWALASAIVPTHSGADAKAAASAAELLVGGDFALRAARSTTNPVVQAAVTPEGNGSSKASPDVLPQANAAASPPQSPPPASLPASPRSLSELLAGQKPGLSGAGAGGLAAGGYRSRLTPAAAMVANGGGTGGFGPRLVGVGGSSFGEVSKDLSEPGKEKGMQNGVAGAQHAAGSSMASAVAAAAAASAAAAAAAAATSRWPPAVGSGAGNGAAEDLTLGPSFAPFLGVAACISRQVQDSRFPRHQVQRAKDLLRCAQWLLLTVMGEVYASLGTNPPASLGEELTQREAIESALTGEATANAVGVCLAHVLSSVLHLLQVVAHLIGDLGHCPPELLVALWTLRGYVYEKQGRVDMCFVDYLQALSTIDEAWGDPRKRGGRGHPFALLLAWKLGLISYCRGDVKSIDKFADYFRSLMLHYATSCPFTWGPPLWPSGLVGGTKGQPHVPVTSHEALEEQDIGRLLWSNEAYLWTTGSGVGPNGNAGATGMSTGCVAGAGKSVSPLRVWWRQHDVLNFGVEGLGLPRSRMSSSGGGDTATAAGPAAVVAAVSSAGAGGVGGGIADGIGSSSAAAAAIASGAVGGTAAELSAAGGLSASQEMPLTPSGDDSAVNTTDRPKKAAQSGRQRELMNPEGSIASDMQEVRRGTIFAFGSNQLGQLGVGRPTTATAAPRFVTGSGTGGVLGGLGAGAAGRLASNACNGESSDLWWSGRPVRVMALKECRVKDIACGESHCVAIDLDGQLFAWGSDEWGQVGAAARKSQANATGKASTHDDDKASFLPVSIMPMGSTLEAHLTGPSVHFAAVACGAQFSAAVDRTGAIWTWGCGEGGVLGLGIDGLSGRASPARVEALASSPCTGISCGSYHATALVGGGKLHTWGRAEGGQLGLSEARINAHIEEKGLEDTCVCDPMRVHFGPRSNTGGITAEGPVASSLLAGRLQDPDAAEDGVRLRQVGCGDVHCCALEVTGQVWSWGWGEFGQLGLGFSSANYELGLGGASSKRPTPERIQARHFEHMRIRFVACGGAFSAAVGDAGQIGPGYAGNLFLWGANEVGQCALPPKKPTEVAVPTKVRKLMHTVVRSVACGAAHVVSVDAKGQAYSWGSAQYGQLGSSNPPKLFAPPPCDLRESDVGLMTHQPTLIQSVSRLNIMKAACGLHHSLIVSEVDGRSTPPVLAASAMPEIRAGTQRIATYEETSSLLPGQKAAAPSPLAMVGAALGAAEVLPNGSLGSSGGGAEGGA